MPPRMKPLEGKVILIDIGKNINDANIFEESRKSASRIIERGLFSSTVDQFSIILVGSESTDNEQDYPNITVKNKTLESPTWDMLKSVEIDLKPSNATADWLDALIVAINILRDESAGKKFTKLQVAFISNFVNPIRSAGQVDTLIETMKDMHIELVVIGPDDCEEGVQQDNYNLLKQITEETGGGIWSYEDAMDLLSRAKRKPVTPQPWHVNLTLNTCEIPVTGYKRLEAAKPLSIKKAIFKKEEAINGSSSQTGSGETGGVEVDEVLQKNITTETVYYNKDDQVDRSQLVKGVILGGSKIPFSDEDRKSAALETEKCLIVIAFTKKKNVPRHMILGDSSHCIVPKAGLESAAKAVTALVKQCLRTKKVALVRKVYRRGTKPQLGALIPVEEEGSCYFNYVTLPFAEDCRNLEKLKEASIDEPNEAQCEVMGRLIDAMDLTEFEDDPYALRPNPNQEMSFQMLKMKALYGDNFPSDAFDDVHKLVEPVPELKRKAAPIVQEVKKLFSLEKCEKKSYRREAASFFNRSRDIKQEPASETMPSSSIAGNRPELAGIIKTEVTEIGTVNPTADFAKLCAQGEDIAKLCDQLRNVIKRLVFVSSNTAGCDKTIKALSLLRLTCVDRQCPAEYNTFITSLKHEIQERNVGMQFWERVVAEKAGLIPTSESLESDATNFYEMEKPEAEDEPNYEMEAEELLDEL